MLNDVYSDANPSHDATGNTPQQSVRIGTNVVVTAKLIFFAVISHFLRFFIMHNNEKSGKRHANYIMQ